MDFEDIKSIVELMNNNSISDFEMEKEDFKIKLRRGMEGYTATTSEGGPYLLTPPPPALPSAPPAPSQPSAPAAEAPASSNDNDITSPMIGTFYSAPSPDAAPYVEVGTQVDPDTVVCIIEAMKVMNEIKAETKGVITEIVADNGKPVEFGQVLYKVKPE